MTPSPEDEEGDEGISQSPAERHNSTLDILGEVVDGTQENRNQSLGGESTKYNSAIAILGESTQNRYERIRSALIGQFGISLLDLTSYYLLTKSRPKIEALSFQSTSAVYVSRHLDSELVSEEHNCDDISSQNEMRLIPIHTENSQTSGVA